MLKKHKNLALLVLKLVFIAGALYWVFSKIDTDKFAQYLLNIHPGYFLTAVIFSMVSMSFSALRSQKYFEHYGLKFNLKYANLLYFTGAFFSAALPGGISGDLYKAIHLHNRFSYSKLSALRVIFYERVNGFYALCFIGFALFYWSNFVGLPNGFALNTALFLLLTPLYIFGAKKIIHDKFAAIQATTVLSFIVQIFQVFLALAMLYALDVPIGSRIDFLVLFIAGSALSILPISIGGIGLRELTFLYGSHLLSAPHITELAVAFASGIFIVALITAFFGLPCYLYLLKQNWSKT